MRDGFIKVAAGTPKIRVADCAYNAQQCIALIGQAAEQGVKVLCLPELCLTGYTCADLFLQDTLLQGAEEALETVLEATKEVDMLIAVGLPVRSKWDNKLYNCAAVLHKGVGCGLCTDKLSSYDMVFLIPVSVICLKDFIHFSGISKLYHFLELRHVFL